MKLWVLNATENFVNWKNTSFKTHKLEYSVFQAFAYHKIKNKKRMDGEICYHLCYIIIEIQLSMQKTIIEFQYYL